MPRTIVSNYLSGLNLTNAADNPLGIGGGVTIANAAGSALVSNTSYYWTISNSGQISATGAGTTAGFGVVLAAGASLTNTTGARISGYGLGVSIAGAGTVINQGTISANQTAGTSGYSYNATTKSLGAVSSGLFIGGGGVSNASGAAITGTYGGIALGGPGSVTNRGLISASGTTRSAAILLTSGGTVTNGAGGTVTGSFGILDTGALTLVNQATATLSGGRFGLFAITGAGTVTNLGTITGGTQIGVNLNGGGSVTNQAGGRISGGSFGVRIGASVGTVINQGSISGALDGGVYFAAGGTVANQTTGANAGYIGGKYYGVLIKGGLGSVTNLGTIRNQTVFSNQTFVFGGVILGSGGSVNNSGTILGGSNGVRVDGVAGTVLNTGSINSARTSGGGAAVNFRAGGSVTNGGTITGAFDGIYVSGGTASVLNTGSVFSSQSLAGAAAVDIKGGGVVTNNGSITGSFYGIAISGGAGTVINTGSVSSVRAGGGGAIEINGSATVTNTASGVISSPYIGVEFGSILNLGTGAAPGGTLVNQGTIFASNGSGNAGAAVWMHGPGVVINEANAAIAAGPLNGTANGPFGIVTYYQTTVVNRGTIGGGIAFDPGKAGFGNLIEIAPGSAFGGTVLGTKNAADAGLATLELLSGASTGVVTGFGTKYLNFGNVTIDNGARWNLNGTVSSATTIRFAAGGNEVLTIASAGSMNGTIAGFAAGDTLTLGDVASVTSAVIDPIGVLTIQQGGGAAPVVLKFAMGGQTFSSQTFGQILTSSGGAVAVSCFAAGTLIRTTMGPVPVERLRPGLRAVTRLGEAAEMIWIGHRVVDCQHHPDPAAVCPVRINASAFGPGLPARDLMLSPDHAVYVDAVLIPIRCLINGVSIRQLVVPSVTYYHVELPEHGVILAEDLPVESYLEAGDRSNFSNGGGAVRLFPLSGERHWEMSGCAPLVQSGPILETIRRRLGTPRLAPWTRLNNRYTYY